MSAMASQLLFVGLILIVTTNVQSRTFDINEFQKKDVSVNFPFPISVPRNTASMEVFVIIFYESMCPASRKFFTKYYSELVSKLDPYVDFYELPFGKAKGTIDTLHNASLSSLSVECQHGEAECYGNKLHICTHEVMKSKSKLHKPEVDFITCLMELDKYNNGSNNKIVDECGSKLNIDKSTINDIKLCAASKFATYQLLEIGLVSTLHEYTSLPHLKINFGVWNGKPENLIKDVCAYFTDPPEPCKAHL